MKKLFLVIFFSLIFNQTFACIGDNSGNTDVLGPCDKETKSESGYLTTSNYTLSFSIMSTIKVKVDDTVIKIKKLSVGNEAKRKLIYLKLYKAFKDKISIIKLEKQKAILEYFLLLLKETDKPNAISSELKDCSKDFKCIDTEFCYNSQFVGLGPNGTVIGEQEGDLKCHQKCDNTECPTGSACQEIQILAGDTATIRKLCILEKTNSGKVSEIGK